MEDRLVSLNKKIRFILEEKSLPENIKKAVEKVYQEYREFFEENIKPDILANEQVVAVINIERYFEGKYEEALRNINDKYKDRCIEKAEVTNLVLSTIESQKSENLDKQIKKDETSMIESCIKNDKSNYLYNDYIINKVIASIESSKNQMFRVLEELKINNQRMQYIYEKIKLIENTAKLSLGRLKEELDIDDEQILRQIFDEYEQYKQNKEENENKSEHQKFVEQYTVPPEDLQRKSDLEPNSTSQEKQYESLPDNVIE